MVRQQLSVLLADSARLLKALVRVEGELLPMHVELGCLPLKHVGEGGRFAGAKLVVDLLDVCGAVLAEVAPLAEILLALE